MSPMNGMSSIGSQPDVEDALRHSGVPRVPSEGAEEEAGNAESEEVDGEAADDLIGPQVDAEERVHEREDPAGCHRDEQPELPRPVSAQTTMPKNAPMSIIPSRPMFTTPERSEKIPPIAANVSGVAKRSVEARRPVAEDAASFAASSPWNQRAASTATGDTDDHQPSFISPRVTPPESEEGHEDGDRGRNGDVAHREGRQGEPERKGAQPDPGDGDRSRLAEPADVVACRLPGLVDGAHVSGSGFAALLPSRCACRPPEEDDEELGADEEDDRGPGSSWRGSWRARGRRPPDRAAGARCPT